MGETDQNGTLPSEGYPCPYCGKTHKSRQARHAHKKTCPQRPKDEPAAPPATIEENRETYEKDHGVTIPGHEPDEEDEEEGEAEPWKFDPLIAVVGIVILLVVGVMVFREKIAALLGGAGQPPRPPRPGATA